MDLPSCGSQGESMDLPSCGSQGESMDLPSCGSQGESMDLPSCGSQGESMDLPSCGSQGESMDLPSCGSQGMSLAQRCSWGGQLPVSPCWEDPSCAVHVLTKIEEDNNTTDNPNHQQQPESMCNIHP
ncbi:unnamed protein product, partial [Ranitomeya imitator]